MLENSLASELILPNGKGSRQVSSGIIHLLGLFTMKWKNESLVRGTELNEKWVRLVDIKKRRTIKMNQLSRSGLPWPPLFYLSNSNRRIVMSYSLHRDPVGEASLSLLLYNALYCIPKGSPATVTQVRAKAYSLQNVPAPCQCASTRAA